MKSSYSFANGNCVEVARTPDGHVIVWHSRQPDPGHPRILFTRSEWEAFLFGVNGYEFEYGKLPVLAGQNS